MVLRAPRARTRRQHIRYVTLTADDTEIAAASGITLCHATQVIGYSVELDDLTADEADRSFDVTYTILQTAAPTFPGG